MSSGDSFAGKRRRLLSEPPSCAGQKPAFLLALRLVLGSSHPVLKGRHKRHAIVAAVEVGEGARPATRALSRFARQHTDAGGLCPLGARMHSIPWPAPPGRLGRHPGRRVPGWAGERPVRGGCDARAGAASGKPVDSRQSTMPPQAAWIGVLQTTSPGGPHPWAFRGRQAAERQSMRLCRQAIRGRARRQVTQVAARGAPMRLNQSAKPVLPAPGGTGDPFARGLRQGCGARQRRAIQDRPRFVRRCPHDRASVAIECRAAADHHGLHPAAMRSDPQRLLRATQAHEYRSRTRGVDRCHRSGIFRFGLTRNGGDLEPAGRNAGNAARSRAGMTECSLPMPT